MKQDIENDIIGNTRREGYGGLNRDVDELRERFQEIEGVMYGTKNSVGMVHSVKRLLESTIRLENVTKWVVIAMMFTGVATFGTEFIKFFPKLIP